MLFRMEADMSRLLRDLATSEPAANGGDSYVRIAKRLYLTGDGTMHFSEAISMEGYNALFIECTVFAFDGFADPLLNISVDVSNDKQNWANWPLGAAVLLSIATVGYFKLDQSSIGQQFAARWIRLRYETTGDIKIICSVGLDRKRLGM
jgi:hypothetical protein